jgi:hypothetical protein
MDGQDGTAGVEGAERLVTDERDRRFGRWNGHRRLRHEPERPIGTVPHGCSATMIAIKVRNDKRILAREFLISLVINQNQ